MGQREHQRKLDASRELETALEEGVRMNRAALQVLERRNLELLVRIEGAEKTLAAIIDRMEFERAFGSRSSGGQSFMWRSGG